MGVPEIFRQSLDHYTALLKDSFVLKDLEAYRRAPEVLENPRLYEAYPKLACALASRLFTVDGSEATHLLAKVMCQIKESGIGLTRLAADSWKGARNL